jgi:glucose/arabinose dehydrogenase
MLRSETLLADLDRPWALTELPSGDWLISLRAGELLRFRPGSEAPPSTIHGVPAVLGNGQAGLFDVLIDQDFQRNQRVFLSYACGQAEANHSCLASAVLGQTQLSDVREIFRSQPAKAGFAHFGGRVLQLKDASLLMSMGEGFDRREQAQIIDNLLGSVVRIMPDGSIPTDNPFLDQAKARPELFSIGHRNPQGLVWHPQLQAVISHEHGPRGGDEINRLQPGGNYGWPLASFGKDYTGALITPFQSYPDTIDPLWQWTPSIAPSDMAVYEGSAFPGWQGDLLITSLAEKRLHRLSISDNGIVERPRMLDELDQRLRAVRVARDGSIMVLTDGPEAQLIRLTPASD